MSGGNARVERDRRGRRLRERDRHGQVVSTLTWSADRLTEATVRLPDASWLRIVPAATHDPRWGRSDVVEHAGVALTQFAALDWAALDAIPPLAEPARLPPGAGTAVLNLVAALARDQGRPALTYRGPYPTEQLFLALLESFRWQPARGASADEPTASRHPLERFLAGELVWAPAPHARVFDPRGPYVQWRNRVEKVVWGGRAYYRPDWQGVQRRAAHRVREVGDRLVCSLWALEAPLEDHVVLTVGGDVLEARAPALPDAPARPLPPALVAGMVALVVAGSAPPLARALEEVAATLAFEWAPLAGDLAALAPGHARVSARLREALAGRLATSGGRAEQLRLGLAALAEAAHGLGDGLRRAAQARLAAAPEAVQAATLRQGGSAAGAAAARAIGEAVECLLTEAGQRLA